MIESIAVDLPNPPSFLPPLVIPAEAGIHTHGDGCADNREDWGDGFLPEFTPLNNGAGMTKQEWFNYKGELL